MSDIRIIIAEDEKWTRKSLWIILRKAGYDITLAENGKKAIDIINTEHSIGRPFDLLICDIEMPELSGFDVLDAMKKQNITIPTLIMTGYGDAKTLKKLKRKGCKDFILKPFDKDELKEKVNEVICEMNKKGMHDCKEKAN